MKLLFFVHNRLVLYAVREQYGCNCFYFGTNIVAATENQKMKASQTKSYDTDVASKLNKHPENDIKMTKTKNQTVWLFINLPGDIDPTERWERYADPLASALGGTAEIVGGGSNLNDGKIGSCDIDLKVTKGGATLAIKKIRAFLQKVKAPRGSSISRSGSDEIYQVFD